MRRSDLLLLVLLLASSVLPTLAQEPLDSGAHFVPLVLGPPAASPTASPKPTAAANPVYRGEGTYYAATGAGNCSFDPSPENLLVAAMNELDYGNADLCGAFVAIRGPQGSVTVRVVDRCPECKRGDIDMSPQAFDQIARRSDGRVPISWTVVSPAIVGTIAYRFKEGSSQWWTAVQVRNHRNPIAKFEYRTASGQFKEAKRERYNYFIEPAGMGPGPYTFRLTDAYGNVLTDSAVPLREGAVVAGGGQFPQR